MKKTLVSLLLAGTIGLGTLGGSAKAQNLKLKPYGYLELAYVPKRTFFQRYENEYMTKLGLGLNTNFKKFDFNINIEQTTYSNHKESIFFHPNTQVYDISLELKKKFQSSSLSLFFSHECNHPVDESPFWLYDSERDKYFRMNYADLTKVGLRFEFGGKKLK